MCSWRRRARATRRSARRTPVCPRRSAAWSASWQQWSATETAPRARCRCGSGAGAEGCPCAAAGKSLRSVACLCGTCMDACCRPASHRPASASYVPPPTQNKVLHLEEEIEVSPLLDRHTWAGPTARSCRAAAAQAVHARGKRHGVHAAPRWPPPPCPAHAPARRTWAACWPSARWSWVRPPPSTTTWRAQWRSCLTSGWRWSARWWRCSASCWCACAASATGWCEAV